MMQNNYLFYTGGSDGGVVNLRQLRSNAEGNFILATLRETQTRQIYMNVVAIIFKRQIE